MENLDGHKGPGRERRGVEERGRAPRQPRRRGCAGASAGKAHAGPEPL